MEAAGRAVAASGIGEFLHVYHFYPDRSCFTLEAELAA
jgi:hypothetical protein